MINEEGLWFDVGIWKLTRAASLVAKHFLALSTYSSASSYCKIKKKLKDI